MWSVIWIPACNSAQIDLGKQLKSMQSKTGLGLSAVPRRASSSPSLLFCHFAELPPVIPTNTWKLSPCSCMRTEHHDTDGEGTICVTLPWQNCWAQHNPKARWSSFTFNCSCEIGEKPNEAKAPVLLFLLLTCKNNRSAHCLLGSLNKSFYFHKSLQ